ncbi:SNF2 family DNA or RNA helicase [Fonticella tunisiensis]|uniref:SNF2 family DNA or RNA helicase n=1 Tax=Fonticella tunisiensis TaxID=1096341 RepID=A0A4R7KTI9_9CLOT|nr:SNF2 family DNA or RNA helicase [Fonticella tunisiensis]
MFNITKSKIKKLCTNSNTFFKGYEYYLEGRVKIVDIDIRDGLISAVVSGGQEYEVILELSYNDDEVEYAQCECPAYAEYPGYCKHIAAVLFQLMEMEDIPYQRKNQIKVDDSRNQLADEIIDFFDYNLNRAHNERLEMELTLELLSEGYNEREITPALSMKLGTQKLYSVKSIKGLLKAMENYETIEFGKNFTFNPERHSFKDEDEAIIEFLEELYEMDKMMAGDYGFGYIGKRLFKGKYVLLPDRTAERFLRLVENRPLKVIAFGDKYDNVKIIKEDLPVKFSLKKDNSDLLLNADIPAGIIPLTVDGKYMFLNGVIYNISKSQRKNLAPFYSMLARYGSSNIRFSEDQREKFVSLIMPNIKRAGEFSIDKSAEGMFYEKPLEARVYIDKAGKRVTVSVNFIYGEYNIDPFYGKNELNSSRIVVRDREGEKRIMDLLEDSGFKVGRDTLYIEDDERIYDFITHYVPILQEMCEVYYSDEFKKIKIYDSSYYRSSIRLNEETDLLEFSFSIEGIDRKSLPDIFNSLKQKKKFYHLEDGSFIPLDSEGLGKVSDMMESLGLKESDLEKEIIDLPKFKAMYMDEKLREFESGYIERNIAFKRLVESIKEPRDTDFKVPDSLKNIMRSYQITGFKWLKTLASYGLGGILADDMGLGKTLQTIAFIQSEVESVKLPSLVVCPTSLVYNWESEIQKFAPSLKALVISGGKRQREEQIKEIPGVDVVITSYPLIRRDIEHYRKMEFGYCILDEAQHIKNPNSINAKSVKEIRAKGYFALTGTPIENNLTELWSIFDFLMPGYLLSHQKFLERFERPIASGDKNALEDLNKHVKPFILRRLKKDVLKELPPKIESLLSAELTEGQKKIYLAYLEQIKGQIENKIREDGLEKSYIQILAGLTRLRQICCHPSLFIENYNEGSGKMDMLMELLEELREGGHRVLLFSQFTGALKLIKEQLEREKISYFYLDGSTKAEDREEMVRAFNQGFRDVFLISLKAGGTGLNLTGADTVIHFDPWWNPAVEEQASDRAYRIGQKNSVQVMKLITKGTIEEKIYNLQQKKKELINSVLQSGENFISKMTEEEIKELFAI